MTTPIKRYDFFCSYDGGGPADEVECAEGDFVTYTDHIAAIEAAVKSEREACAWLCENGSFTLQDGNVYGESAPRTPAACAKSILARQPKEAE